MKIERITLKLGPKTRDILELLLLVGTDALTSLPLRNYHSLAGWESEHALRRQLRAMQNRGLITLNGEKPADWVPQITKIGRNLAKNDIDPQVAWSSAWEGKWRIVSFDLPQDQPSQRYHLNLWLKQQRFGRLQGSLWISHRFSQDWHQAVSQIDANPHDVIFLDSTSIGKLSAGQIVAYAWDFKKINALYGDYLQFLKTNPPAHSGTGQMTESQVNWFRSEHSLWRKAYAQDPFLSKELLPSSYLGRRAFLARQEMFKTKVLQRT